MIERTVTLKGRTYQLDEQGFLCPADQWDENFAQGMSEKLGIVGGLTEAHWRFITYLRKKFREEGTVPVVVVACAENGLRLREFRRLFPTGYHRGACRIAGIDYAFMLNTNHWLTYETSPVLKAEFKMTPVGYLEDFEQWNERFVDLILREWKRKDRLGQRHWQVIDYLRETYRKTGTIPTVVEACKANQLNLEELWRLFPEGYRRGACRIAGLPFFG